MKVRLDRIRPRRRRPRRTNSSGGSEMFLSKSLRQLTCCKDTTQEAAHQVPNRQRAPNRCLQVVRHRSALSVTLSHQSSTHGVVQDAATASIR
jgi:hypothetical protein